MPYNHFTPEFIPEKHLYFLWTRTFYITFLFFPCLKPSAFVGSFCSSTFSAASSSLLQFCRCTIYLIRVEQQSSDSRCEARPIDITAIDSLIVKRSLYDVFYFTNSRDTFHASSNAATSLCWCKTHFCALCNLKFDVFFVNSREQISLCSCATWLCLIHTFKPAKHWLKCST